MCVVCFLMKNRASRGSMTPTRPQNNRASRRSGKPRLGPGILRQRLSSWGNASNALASDIVVALPPSKAAELKIFQCLQRVHQGQHLQPARNRKRYRIRDAAARARERHVVPPNLCPAVVPAIVTHVPWVGSPHPHGDRAKSAVPVHVMPHPLQRRICVQGGNAIARGHAGLSFPSSVRFLHKHGRIRGLCCLFFDEKPGKPRLDDAHASAVSRVSAPLNLSRRASRDLGLLQGDIASDIARNPPEPTGATSPTISEAVTSWRFLRPP